MRRLDAAELISAILAGISLIVAMMVIYVQSTANIIDAQDFSYSDTQSFLVIMTLGAIVVGTAALYHVRTRGNLWLGTLVTASGVLFLYYTFRDPFRTGATMFLPGIILAALATFLAFVPREARPA